MAPFTFNVAKGRVRELVERVDTNDPADAKLIIVPLSVGTTEAEAQDYDTLAAFLGGTANEQTHASWGRKTLTDTDLSPTDYDANDTDNRGEASIPQISWTAPATGNNTQALVVCYNEEASPTDAATIPLTYHDFVVNADGNQVVINPGDFFRAS